MLHTHFPGQNKSMPNQLVKHSASKVALDPPPPKKSD